MPDERAVNWQPVSALPLIGRIIDESLQSIQEVYQDLMSARDRPHVLDDHTVGRVKEVYTAQRDDHGLYEEQLARWRQEPLSPTQQEEVERLEKQAARLRETLDAILALADELAQGTIEKVLAKSDLEVGLEALLGKYRPRP